MHISPPLVMTFSALDSTGGAGLTADVLTIFALHCHPLSIATGLTIQNTATLKDFQILPADFIKRSAHLILEESKVAAFKIGVVGSVENAKVIAEIVDDFPDIPVIFDPILQATSGGKLATEDFVSAARQYLIPRATIITPNVLELKALCPELEKPTPPQCADFLFAQGAREILVTGTNNETPTIENMWFSKNSKQSFLFARLAGEFHGSGCTLSSAIAAFLACGENLNSAIPNALEWTHQTLENAFLSGKAQKTPQRFLLKESV